jgi:hypothetical protein
VVGLALARLGLAGARFNPLGIASRLSTAFPASTLGNPTPRISDYPRLPCADPILAPREREQDAIKQLVARLMPGDGADG